jgi:hypothetical protein
MSITLDEVLMMVGRLDDAPGFDTSRERFRRFITGYVGSVAVARSFIEQSQHSLGEQYHRALQDLVVLLGRFLGLDTEFGSYLPAPGALTYGGQWRYPRRLTFVLDVRTDQTPGADLEGLSKTVAALEASSRASSEPHPVGLCLLSPLYPSRARLEEQIAAHPENGIQIASIRSLLTMADLMRSGQLGQEEVLRLLSSGLGIDFVVELLQRFAGGGANALPEGARATPAEASEMPGFWIAAVLSDGATTAEQVVERMIGKRHLFGLRHTGVPGSVARPGDQICFHLPGAGIVAHATVSAVSEDGTCIRDAGRFSHVLHLEHAVLHRAPVTPRPDIQRRLDGVRDNPQSAPALIHIDEREFGELTAAAARVPTEPDRREPAATAADSR